jgi:hypothetical protein
MSWTTKKYEVYKAAVDRNLKGLEFISTGACPGCDQCGLEKDCSEHALELAGEAGFSWSPCESCGSALGGDRYPAHGRDSNDGIVHFTACVDCLHYLNYGQLDDASMDKIGGVL